MAGRVLIGQTLVVVAPHHTAQRRGLPPRDVRRIIGRRVTQVVRRAKHQHLVLDDGAIIAVHFRMNGDWVVGRVRDPLPPYARVVFETKRGARLSLVDSRALCSVIYHAPNALPQLALGPEPEALTATALRRALEARRGPIKPLLLDQRVVAGLGNIYAAEALWRSRIHPARTAGSLTMPELRALVRGIRHAIADGFARQGRYRSGALERPFRVYDREGHPCPRCRQPVRRISQAGRSTYFCASCQSHGPSARPRARRPVAP